MYRNVSIKDVNESTLETNTFFQVQTVAKFLNLQFNDLLVHDFFSLTRLILSFSLQLLLVVYL